MKIEIHSDTGPGEFRWRGNYRGIQWLIKLDYRPLINPGHPNWCAYINLTGERAEKYWNNTDFLEGLEWHGGITFLEKRIALGIDVTEYGEKEYKTIRAGCDFMHAWDLNNTYDFDYVLHYIKQTIDDLLEKEQANENHS